MAARGKNSQPGPDGLRDAAWGQAPPRVLALLDRVRLEVQDDAYAPSEFCVAIGVYPPKGKREEDHVDVVRKAAETRPLSLKNSDNKIICGTINWTVRSAISSRLCSIQRGFKRGAQLIENILDVDTSARISGLPAHQHLTPLLILFDFLAAFPSVSHDWLAKVLKMTITVCGLVDFVKALYHCPLIVTASGDIGYLVLRGILQGCPLSGLLFAIAIDPILRMGHARIDVKLGGTLRACADDIAAVVRRLEHLRPLLDIFRTAELVATLQLNHKKCVIIPVGEIFNAAVVKRIVEWLAQSCPQWEHFEICEVGEYLGIWIGPAAKGHTWAKVLKKIGLRALALGNTPAGASHQDWQFNARVHLCGSYAGQLIKPPGGFARQDLQAWHKALHLAPNTFSIKASLTLSMVGLPNAKSLECCAIAAGVRTALVTLPMWENSWAALRSCDDMPLKTLSDEKYWGKHWQSEAIVYRLRRLVDGDCRRVPLRRALKEAVDEARKTLAKDNRKIQGSVYHKLVEAWPGVDLRGLIQKRLSHHLSIHAVIDVKLFMTLLQTVPFHWRWAALKTALGGWTTSCRLHETQLLPCVIGCRGKRDEWCHYLNECRIWGVVSKAVPLGCPRDRCERLAFIFGTTDGLRLPYLVFYVYGKLKENLKTRGSCNREAILRLISAAAQVA